MAIDLPYEGRKVEGSRKYRVRERVPKVGSRREETITELINSGIGEFHTIVVGKRCPTCGTLEVEYERPVRQRSDQSNSGRKEIVKPPCAQETEGQESRPMMVLVIR